MRRLAIAVIVVSSLVVALTGAAFWTASELAIRPAWYGHRTPEQGLNPDPLQAWEHALDPARDFGYAFDDVEFATEGGGTLRGWWVPGNASARVGIVTVHGAGADRRDFLRHLPVFHEAGYPVLLFDCREHGISDGAARGVSFGVREHADVIAAVGFARQRGGLERVASVGTSQGGASVILAAARDPSIDAVVSENPFTDIGSLIRDGASVFDERARDAPRILEWIAAFTSWRLGASAVLSPIAAISAIAPRPLLLMHGTDDQVIPVAHSRALHEAAPFSELWIAPGARHAALFDADPVEWRLRVLGFLERSVGAALVPRP